MPPAEPGNSESERLNKGSTSADNSKNASRVCFGLYEVDLQARELRKGGLKLKIPNQSFQILAMLLERPGEVVSREDLRRKLWQSDVFVNFEAGLNSAVQRLRSALQDTSLEPRYIETLPKVGYRFIASVEAVVAVSDEAPPAVQLPVSAELPPVTAIPDPFSPEPALRNSNWPYWSAAILLLIVFATYFAYRYVRRNRPMPVAQVQSSIIIPATLNRRSVAVMGFANVSGNDRDVWLSTAFTEMLNTELSAGDRLKTVAEEDVARAKLELSLTNKDSYSGSTLGRIRGDIGCDYIVAGSYLAIGPTGSGRVRLDARVQDAVTGDTVASFAVVGSQSDIFDLASRAGEHLRAKLGIGTLTSDETEEAKLALPSNPEAARLYSDGVTKLRVDDDVAARDLFEKAIAVQPDSSPVYSALATAWHALGYDAKATAAARRAMDLAGGLPEQSRLQTEARFREMNQDWAQAVQIYSRLQRSYPDNLDYGLDLSKAQLNMGNSAGAAATVSYLRKLPPPQGDDPRIDLAEAGIASDLADYKREQVLARKAARKSEAAGARLLLARANLVEGWALDNLGDFNGAMGAYAVSQRVFAESGNLRDSATVLMDESSILAKRGDIAGATQRTEQALVVFRKNGDQASLAAALSNLGELYGSEGDLPRAERLVHEAVNVFGKLNMRTKQDITTYNLAELLRQQGNIHEAKEMLEPLVERLGGGGNKSLLAAAKETLGSIAETQGEMPPALHMYQEAAAVLKDSGARTEYAGAQRSLARALLREADFASASKALSEALPIDRDSGAKGDTALDQVALAQLALAQKGSVDIGALRSAIDELRAEKMTDDEIEAEIVLAREIVQQDNTAEAADIMKRATILSAKSYDPMIRFDVALATAYLRASQHHFDDARRTVRPAMQSVVAVGCVRCQLEARLELGEIDIQAGEVQRGRAQLRVLAEDADHRGFRLIAEHAAANSK